ncbi:hypothetical protein ACFX12_039463 [Malus domestica]
MEATKATKGIGGRRGRKMMKLVFKSVKAGLQFPVGHIAHFLKKVRYTQRTSTGLQFPIAPSVFLPLDFLNLPQPAKEFPKEKWISP